MLTTSVIVICMNNVTQKLKNFLVRVSGLFPTALPQGLTEFNNWSAKIVQAYNPAPGVALEEMRAILGTMILGLKSTESHVSLRFFAKCLHKGAANQVASQVFYDYKQAQKAAEQAAKQAATSPTGVASATAASA